MTRVVAAVVTAILIGVGASVLMTRASNRSALWNILVGGAVVAVLALVVFLAVVVVERIAFE